MQSESIRGVMSHPHTVYWRLTVLLTSAHWGLSVRGTSSFSIISPISTNLQTLIHSLTQKHGAGTQRRATHFNTHKPMFTHRLSETPGTEGRGGPTQTLAFPLHSFSYLFLSLSLLLSLSCFFSWIFPTPADTAASQSGWTPSLMVLICVRVCVCPSDIAEEVGLVRETNSSW